MDEGVEVVPADKNRMGKVYDQYRRCMGYDKNEFKSGGHLWEGMDKKLEKREN